MVALVVDWVMTGLPENAKSGSGFGVGVGERNV